MNTYGQTALIRLEKGGRRHTVKKLRKSNNRNDFDFDLNCFIKIGILLEFNTKNDEKFFYREILKTHGLKDMQFRSGLLRSANNLLFFHPCIIHRLKQRMAEYYLLTTRAILRATYRLLITMQ